MGKDIALRKEELALQQEEFDLENRKGKALAVSAFFPKELKNDVASAIIVYDLAKRMDASVMEVAQSLFIIHGRPSFSTTYLVARLNNSGLIKGALRTFVSEDKSKAYAEATDAETGEVLKGLEITMTIAKAEGWIDKKGSKWKTMPELMLRKRAQAFFIREFYPQVTFGASTQEELIDVEASDIVAEPEAGSKPLERPADILNKAKPAEAKEEVATEAEIIIDIPETAEQAQTNGGA